MPTNTFFVALATLFATVGVADIAFIFAALTKDHTPSERFIFATRGVIIAAVILLFFAVLGNPILELFGITIPALRTAGGVLLLLIAIDMVFARHSGATNTTTEEDVEARQRHDISVFPAGHAAAGRPRRHQRRHPADHRRQNRSGLLAVLVAIVVILALAWLLCRHPVQRLLGITGLAVVSRVVGILLAALAVQFIFDGVVQRALGPNRQLVRSALTCNARH